MQHQPIRLIQPHQFQLYLQLHSPTVRKPLPTVTSNTIVTHLQTYKIINSPNHKSDQLMKGTQKEQNMYKIYEHSRLNQMIQHYYENLNLDDENINDTSFLFDRGSLQREGEGGKIGEMGGGVNEVGICRPGLVYFLCEQNDIQSIEQVKQLLKQQIIGKQKKKLEQNCKQNKNKQVQNDTKIQVDLQRDIQSDQSNLNDCQAQTCNQSNTITKDNLSCNPIEQNKQKLPSNQSHSLYRGKKNLNKDRGRKLSTVGQRFRKDINGKENYMNRSNQFVNIVLIKDGEIFNQFQNLKHCLIKDHCLNFFDIYEDKNLQNKVDAHTLTATKDNIYYLKHKNPQSQPCSPIKRSAIRLTILRGSSNLKQEQVLKKIRIYRSLHKQDHINQKNQGYSYCNADGTDKNDMQKQIEVDKAGRRCLQEYSDGVKGQRKSFKVRNLWRKEKQMKKSEKMMQIFKVYCKKAYGKVMKQQKQQKMKKSE